MEPVVMMPVAVRTFPAKGLLVDVCSVTEERSDDDYAYFAFASTYRPLSNLPTPPPSSGRDRSALPSLPLEQDGAEEDFLGPAVHLVNMVPPAASLATASVPLVQTMLARAALPLDTVALAVCILDSLDVRFSRSWRLTCPLEGDEVDEKDETDHEDGPDHAPTMVRPPIKRHTLPLSAAWDSSNMTLTSPTTPTKGLLVPSWSSSSVALRHPRHVDAVSPEIIILAALVIAAKFTEDGGAGQLAARVYCAWGQRQHGNRGLPLWTGAQLAATERCIMQSLGYRIMPLMDADLLADARADMRRAGTQAAQQRQEAAADEEERMRHNASLSESLGRR